MAFSLPSAGSFATSFLGSNPGGITADFVLEYLNLGMVENKAVKGAFRSLGHAAAGVRKTAVESIKVGTTELVALPSGRVVSRRVPSPPGTPPHTHTAGTTRAGKPRRGVLPRAIVYVEDKANLQAVVGPRYSVVGEAGAAHEFGGEFRGDRYPARPFMGPALDRNLERFGKDMDASMGP